MKSFLEFITEAKAKIPTIEVVEPRVPTRNDFRIAEHVQYTEEELREHYIAGELFKEGALIEQFSTGKVGTVMRRGTNYLICLTDEGDIFKPWISDVAEIEE